ncbi:MAG: hypothetical protein JXE07_02315, partial [Candidatus Aminicenantes bacterium]|nr:hypothetical protein [Candidatus Aminicenantes bacterium]
MKTRRDDLRAIFKKKRVLLAYLFGSNQDTGRRYIEGSSCEGNESSDLDVGLLIAPSSATMYERYGNLYLE